MKSLPRSLFILVRCLLLVSFPLIIFSVSVSWGAVRSAVAPPPSAKSPPPPVQQSSVPIIAAIDPPSAEPGELITIHTKPPLTRIPGDLLLTFDGRKTEVLIKVGGDPTQKEAGLQVYTLTARVPEGLEPGTRPAIVLHAGKTESLPYRGFLVKSTPMTILSVSPPSGKPGDPLRLKTDPVTRRGPVTVLFDQQEVPGVVGENGEVLVNIPRGPLSDSPVIVLKIGTRISRPYTAFRLERPVPMTYFILGGLLLALVAVLVYYWRSRQKKKSEEASREQLRPALQAAEEITYPAPEIPEDLVTACLRGECALYGGTGFSALAGFPAGKEFVGKLLDWAVKSDFVRGDDADALRSALQQGEIVPTLDSLAIRIQEGGHRQALQKYLVEIFTAVSKPSESHRLLGRIGFSALITPNLDTLTETAAQAADKRLDVFSPQESKGLVDALIKRDFFILKLRGLLSRPETIILSPIQYRDFIQGNLAFREFMESLFIAKTFLFIGASLEEIEYFMDYTRLESTNRTHYAVVNVKGTGWKLKADALQRRYSIKVIPYTPPEPQKECLVPLSLLTERLEAVRQEQKAVEPAKAIPQETYSRLKRVQLENIGPFDMLDLELTEGWNVLLGDNGVGKSNILKGIALGILGRDASEYAERMIKSGKQKGTITLETTTNKVYRTTLENTSTGGVQISVSPPGARPLQTEGWLVVGYPPTRGVRWQRSSGPQPGDTSGAKVLEDLLPVLRGEPDFRLDDLKQLFINIDWFINKGDDEKNTRKYTRLRDGLVRIFNQVTLNMKLDYKGVSKTGEVFFDTDDGVVRIESLSQGTVSLMGWVGYLVRRIYDKYEHYDQPTRGHALVLIDEIDAHMHPGWQRSLVSNLKAIFPGAQIIATTHSPLIPITCEKGEVFLVKRDKHNEGRIQIVRSDIDFRLWRADQVLTSSLFGLESSRDPSISKDIEDYTELMTRDQLSEEDQKRMSYLASRLAVRPPQPFEREEARVAFKSIGDALDEKIAAVPAEKQEKLRREVKAQILESITRSRRPQ